MKNKKPQIPLVSLSLIIGYSSQQQPTLAHSDHFHSAPPEPESTNPEALSQPLEETTNDTIDTPKVESSLMESTTDLEEVPASSESSLPTVSTARLIDGVSFGLGESIFGLLIVTPFLLLFLRKIR